MLYAVEHVGLHRSIMVHILKSESVAGLQCTLKAPVAYEVATETGIAAKAINMAMRRIIRQSFGDSRLIGHFQAVRHMACKRGIDNGRLHALILHDIHHFGHQVAGAPREGAPRLQNHMQMRMPLFESTKLR